MACGSSQTRIKSDLSGDLYHSRGSDGSLIHFAEPGIKTTPPQRQSRILNPPHQGGNSSRGIFDRYKPISQKHHQGCAESDTLSIRKLHCV